MIGIARIVRLCLPQPVPADPKKRAAAPRVLAAMPGETDA
jgi:hypothetical protein